jgi:RNA polymerase sigma-70 factor, ECF subfamily
MPGRDEGSRTRYTATPVPTSDDPNSLADADLVDRVNAGDVRAFEALYWRHRDWVVRLARRFTGDEADALDVMQEAFVYLYRKFPGFVLTARLTTFLWPVVRNLSLQARRRRAMSLALGDVDLDRVDAGAKPRAASSSEFDWTTILSGLSHEHRQVVLMRFVDDLTTDEIAQLLSIPPGTVKSRLHHAIAQLRASPAVRKHIGEA